MYKEFVLEGTKNKMRVTTDFFNELNALLNDILVLFKLTDYQISIVDNGTRSVEMLLKKDYHDQLNINFSIDSEGKLHLLEISFNHHYKNKMYDLFQKDKDIDFGYKKYKNQYYVSANRYDGMRIILQKIQQL